MAAEAMYLGAVGIAEGFYLSHIVYYLHRCGVLEQLRGPATVASIAAEHGYELARLRGALEYVSRRTDILLDTPDGDYALNPEYADYHQLGFHLDKFIGAYGSLARDLDESLRGTARRCRRGDEQLLAEAFTRAGSAGVQADAYVLGQWNVRCLLDLGCRPAALLVHLAASDPEFRGWGVDQSMAMCDVAAARVSEAGLAHAVHITHADVHDLDAVFDARCAASFDAIHCKSLLNEFFGSGSGEATDVIRKLRATFSGRLLFNSDYYGRLGAASSCQDDSAHALVHDVAQLLSGQGVPPATLSDWAEVYGCAGAELMHAYEAQMNGIAWFIHVVQL